MKRQPPRRPAFPRSHGRLLPLVAGPLAALSAIPDAHAAEKPRAASGTYRSGTSRCPAFRVPAADGALLAFAQDRRDSAADDGDIGTGLRRPFDGARDDAYSTGSGEALSTPLRSRPEHPGPETRGSASYTTAETGGPLLYSGPADAGTSRCMEIGTSPGDGRARQRPKTVSEGPEGAFDLARRTPSEAGPLHETGTAGSRETLTYTPLPA